MVGALLAPGSCRATTTHSSAAPTRLFPARCRRRRNNHHHRPVLPPSLPPSRLPPNPNRRSARLTPLLEAPLRLEIRPPFKSRRKPASTGTASPGAAAARVIPPRSRCPSLPRPPPAASRSFSFSEASRGPPSSCSPEVLLLLVPPPPVPQGQGGLRAVSGSLPAKRLVPARNIICLLFCERKKCGK